MNIAIILAAGSGARFESETPKQFVEIGNKKIIQYSIDAFETSQLIDRIIIVVSELFVDEISAQYPDHMVVAGGNSRRESSYNGLRACPEGSKKVLIHDAARPFVSQRIISSCIDALDTHKAVVTSVCATDTIIRAANGEVVDVENRDALFLNQTPQGFEYNTILNAHKNSQKDATDDISLLELDQIKCKIIEGSSNNIKITTSADIHTAGSILNLIK